MAGQLNPQLVDQLARLRNASLSRPVRAGKSSPFLWMNWQEGEPQWQMADYTSYVEEGYEANAVIHAAISYKERAIASVPLRAYFGDPDNPERLPPTHPLTRLVMRPNPYQSWREFQQQRIAYLNLSGNCFTMLDRPSRSEPPTALYNLRPDRVRIVPGRNGGLTGFVYKRNDSDTWKQGAVPILVADMMHKKFINPLDPFEGLGYGLSPLAPLARSGDVDNSITKYLKKLFDQGTMISGILKFKDRIDEATMSRARARWKEIYGGMENWDEIGILDEGADYQRIGMTIKEMDFTIIDDRNESRMLAPFGVPPILVGTRMGMERSTMSNYQEARRQCWEDTLLPELLLIQDDDQYYIQTEDGGYVQYDLSSIPALQKDTPKLIEAAHKLWTMGVPANQALREVGLKVSSIPNGDIAYLPSTVISTVATVQDEQVDDLANVDAVSDDTERPKQLPGKKKDTSQRWTTADKTRLWKKADDIAVNHEAAFRKAATQQFEREKRELLALVGEAKSRSLRTKASIQWDTISESALDVIRRSGPQWREAFTPLVVGVVTDAAGMWKTEGGLAFDVRNLEAEDWFVGYMATFADPITNTSERAISGILQRAQREGWTVAEMQEALDLTFQQWTKGNVSAEDLAFALERMTPWRTELIARTETIRSYGAGSWQIYKANGVQRKEWLSTSDGRTRDTHRKANGQQRSTGEAFEIGGYKMQYPGDMSLGAPLKEVAACRCTVLPLIEDVSPEADVAVPALVKPPESWSTLDDIVAYMKDKYPALEFDFPNSPYENVSAVAKEYDRLAQRYPEVAKRITLLSTNHRPDTPWYKDGSAAAYADNQRGAIVFIDQFFSKPDVQLTPGFGEWLVEDTTRVTGMTTHEFGHHVHNWLRQTRQQYFLDIVGRDGFGSVTETLRMFEKNNTVRERNLSRYGTTNLEERFAESFVAYEHVPRSRWTAYAKRFGVFMEEVADPALRTDNNPTWSYTLPPDEHEAWYQSTEDLRRRLGLQ